MTTHDEHAPERAAPPARRGPYVLQPLACLDGVMIHITANGETAGYAFGPNEESAMTAAGRDLAGVVERAGR